MKLQRDGYGRTAIKTIAALCLLLGLAATPAGAAVSEYTFKAAWPDLEPGDHLVYPSRLAVRPSGGFAVADNGDLTIRLFRPTGSFERKWGSRGATSGRFASIGGLAIDSSGYVYVADTGNNRIQKFGPTGTFVKSWGAFGNSNGKFVNPLGLAVSGNTLFIADNGNDRVQKTSLSGTYLGKWGAYGSGVGKFDGPSGLAIAGDGSLLVSDRLNSRVQRFSQTGAYINSLGSYGSGDGQLGSPIGLATRDDTVIVADQLNSRLSLFTLTGSFIAAVGAFGYDNGEFVHPTDVCPVEGGGWAVADRGSGRIRFLDASLSNAFDIGYPGTGPGRLTFPVSMTGNPTGPYFITDMVGLSRIEPDSTGFTRVKTLGSGNPAYPVIVSREAADRLLVLDSYEGSVLRYSETGTLLAKYKPAGKYQMKRPLGLARDLKGNIVVADTGNNRILRMSSVGASLMTFAFSGLDGPAAVAVDQYNRYYFCDSAHVFRSSSTGLQTGRFGGFGRGGGQLNGPRGLAIGPDGHIYVADTGNNRIQKFNSSGIFLKAFTVAGYSNGKLSSPASVLLEPAGDILVAELGSHRVQKLLRPTDKTAPVLTKKIIPVKPDGANGYYKTRPAVYLLINETGRKLYRVNGGSWRAYSKALTPGRGVWRYEFIAVDAAGNPGALQKLTVKVL